MQRDLKIGDRVRVTGTHTTGTVVGFDEDDRAPYVMVNYDEPTAPQPRTYYLPQFFDWWEVIE